jgi:hypothetical protein
MHLHPVNFMLSCAGAAYLRSEHAAFSIPAAKMHPWQESIPAGLWLPEAMQKKARTLTSIFLSVAHRLFCLLLTRPAQGAVYCSKHQSFTCAGKCLEPAEATGHALCAPSAGHQLACFETMGAGKATAQCCTHASAAYSRRWR